LGVNLLNFNECPHSANANANEEYKEYKEYKEYEEFKERSQEPESRSQEDRGAGHAFRAEHLSVISNQ
jgi:hypothetical protein